MKKQKKLLIYHHYLAEAGGCETFIYNFCTMLRNWYNILVVYDDGHPNQIGRIKSLVNVEKKVPNKIYEGDIVIQNSMWCMFDKGMIAPRVIGMVHTDYTNIDIMTKESFKYVTEFVGCGDNASEKFTAKYGIPCKSIKNLLGELVPVSKRIELVSAGRLSADKGWNRMLEMMRMMKQAGIFFHWTIITDSKVNCDYEEVTILKPRYNIWNYLYNADYGVLLSDKEGYPYFVLECMQYGTPVIGTDTSGISDIIENNKNGYLVPLDMKFDINIIKKIPKVENFTNGVTEETWKDYLGGAVYIEKEKQIPFEYDDLGYRRQVKALVQKWFDEEKVNANIGDMFFVRSEERLKYLLKYHMVKLI